MGAFIRIREPIPRKHMLFDIGIAGPMAGFAVAVPALFLGIAMSHVVRVPANAPGLIELGEPLLFRFASWIFWGSAPDGYSLNMHPVAFAAWFGLLATALNLFPIGQLDGGHVSYAVFGRRSTYVTITMVGVAVGLSYFSSSLILWTAMSVGMLFAFGFRHPPVYDEHVPLDRGRFLLALAALAVFILCFTPAPFRTVDLIGPSSGQSTDSGSTSTTTRRATSGRSASACWSASRTVRRLEHLSSNCARYSPRSLPSGGGAGPSTRTSSRAPVSWRTRATRSAASSIARAKVLARTTALTSDTTGG
jgi:hypothetical protein